MSFLTLSFERTNEGLVLEAQSEELEAFFESHATTSTSYPLFGAEEVELWDVDGLPDTGGGTLTNAQAPLTTPQGDRVNLSFLRAVGLGDGVRIVIGGLYSIEAIKNIESKMQRAVNHIYSQYMQPLDITITLERADLDDQND